MLRKYQSIIDNAKYMNEQIDVYHAKDATLDAQVANLEVELRSAHEAGDIALFREIAKKITALYDEHDMPELRPLQKESHRLVAQMRSIATRLWRFFSSFLLPIADDTLRHGWCRLRSRRATPLRRNLWRCVRTNEQTGGPFRAPCGNDNYEPDLSDFSH
jgi:hypothetical protein